MTTSFQVRPVVIGLSLFTIFCLIPAVYAEQVDEHIGTKQVDPTELLEADPVGPDSSTLDQELNSNENSAEQADSGDQSYPVTPWTTMPTPVIAQPTPPEAMPLKSELIKATWMSPYYFSAYIPDLDKTEVDLGMILSQNPGIDISIAWGALSELMAAAKMSVQGASYTAGIRLKYLLRSENTLEVKPGFSAVLGWRVQNHRTNDDEHLTIYRGNRIYTGIVLSKDLGSLARGLAADTTLINVLTYLRIHCEAVVEYQTGRINETEDELNRIEFGLRSGLEFVIDPNHIYVLINYQSLSDWLNEQDTYLGVRYYPREDFSLDVFGGWFGQQTAVNISLAWLF